MLSIFLFFKLSSHRISNQQFHPNDILTLCIFVTFPVDVHFHNFLWFSSGNFMSWDAIKKYICQWHTFLYYFGFRPHEFLAKLIIVQYFHGPNCIQIAEVDFKMFPKDRKNIKTFNFVEMRPTRNESCWEYLWQIFQCSLCI